jgi:starch phosphorylase
MHRDHSYDPRARMESSPILKRVMEAIGGNRFCEREPGLFRPIYDKIVWHGDEYFHLADLESYIDAQSRVADDFLDRPTWARKAILNVARMGKFSSDRTIREYARDIWGVEPVL